VACRIVDPSASTDVAARLEAHGLGTRPGAHSQTVPAASEGAVTVGAGDPAAGPTFATVVGVADGGAGDAAVHPATSAPARTMTAAAVVLLPRAVMPALSSPPEHRTNGPTTYPI
jgi:hypothetical protein